MLGRRPAKILVLVAMMLSLALVGVVGASAASAAAPIVVASGLNGTFFLATGDDGSVYAYEGGLGNTETIAPPPGTPPPPGETEAAPIQRGLTGSVIKIAPNGTKSTIASGLPSYGGSGATGIVVANGFVWMNVATSAAALYGATPYPTEGFLVKIALTGGAVTPVADLAGYELKNNPDGSDVNPNPWGLALGADGNLYANDAGGNDLLRINPTTGAISVVAIYPNLKGTEANPELGGKLEVQPVPTGLAIAPDGGFYAGNLPGELGTPPPGSGQVVRVSPDGKVTVVATGFNYLVNLAVGPDKQLYVVELIGGFGQQGPLPGRISRVLPNGTKEIVADNLAFPGGIAFNKAGDLFYTTNVTSFGPPPPAPAGTIVRIDGVAKVAAPSPSTTPTPAPPATGNGGNLPGLPNTGAGGMATPSLPVLPAIAAVVALGGMLVVRRARALRSR